MRCASLRWSGQGMTRPATAASWSCAERPPRHAPLAPVAIRARSAPPRLRRAAGAAGSYMVSARHPFTARPGQRRRLPRGGAVERPRRSDQDQHRTGAASEARGGPQRSAGSAGARRGRVEARPLDSAPHRARRRARENRTEAVRLPYSRENVAILSKEEKQPDAEAIAFIWPAKGKVLAGSPSREARHRYRGRIGDPVVAAAAGRVTYSGTGIPGWASWSSSSTTTASSRCTAHKDILVKEQPKRGAPRRSRRSQHRRGAPEAALPDSARIGRRRSDALLPAPEPRAAPWRSLTAAA